MGLATVPEEMVVVDVDLSLEPRCESIFHDDGPHPHGGSATHMMRSPCHHNDGLRCAPIVRAISRNGGYCDTCDVRHAPEEYVFIPV